MICHVVTDDVSSRMSQVQLQEKKLCRLTAHVFIILITHWCFYNSKIILVLACYRTSQFMSCFRLR